MPDEPVTPAQDESTSQNRENPPTEIRMERTFSQADLDRIVQDRVARERQKYGDYEALKERATKFDQYEEAQKTELEKAQERAQAAEKRSEEARQQAQEHLFRSSVVAEAARRRVVDPDAAVALIDRAAITFGEDGTPTGVSDAMDALIQAKSYLTGHGAAAGNADQGARGGADADQLSREAIDRMTPEQIVDAQNKGMLRSVLGG